MKLTFAIPAYNEEKNIGKCLDSIIRELAHGTHDVEIIVIDNASTDGTGDVARRYPNVRVVREEKKGLVYARQRGYAEASGELIANVDADTMLTPGWIDSVFQEFSKDKELLALSGPFIYYDLSVVTRFFVRIFYYVGYLGYLLNSSLGKGSMLQGGNFIVRKSGLDRIGGYDLSIDFYGEDTDIARRLAAIGRTKFTFALPMYTSGRRLRAEGVITMGVRYALNHFWVIFFKKPYTKTSTDIRPETAKPHFFSIVIPAHNEELYIEKTIRHIQGLEYPKDEFEVLVIENGSSDRTHEIAKHYQGGNIRVHTSSKGVSVAKNFGLKMIAPTSDWVIFLDADTQLKPPFLRDLNQYLHKYKHQHLSVGTTRVTPFENNSRNARAWFWFYNFGHKLTKTSFAIQIMKSSLREKVYFDEEIHFAEDLKLIKELLRFGKFFYFDTETVLTSTRRFDEVGWWKQFFKWNWEALVLSRTKKKTQAYTPIR